MAALIKNALIKQLSKFLKNVSANQINISTFKGEGEMKNIQLDENVLMDLLELPTWLRITNVRCNKASVKIQWTKLKTNPIIIMLDKIEIEMEIADPLREYTNSQNTIIAKEPISAYNFIDRCMDGLSVIIDSITISIKSKAFNANLSMSNICVYSTTPTWKKTSDITNTKLKDTEKGEIILYKEISWEICRLEAFIIDSTSINTSQQNNQATSIKLIMNPSKIQIALKKKLSDKSLLCSTFRVLLNEIYWMANDTQLKSAIGTYNTISKLMKKSFVQKRKFANYQQNSQVKPKTPQQSPSTQSNQKLPSQNSKIDISKVFCQYDIKETSLHLHISILNIHLYADDNLSGNKLIDGGALQILFNGLFIDHYPYHKTGSSTKHWYNYNHTFKQREDWSKTLIKDFTHKIQNILNKSNINDLNRIKLKNNINLLEGCTILTLKDLVVYKVTTNMSNSRANVTNKSKKISQNSNSRSADEECKISHNEFLRTKQFFIEQQVYNKRPFLSSNSADFNLPSDTLLAHFFFSEFYFPEEINYPTPCPQLFAQISPILINIDFLTLLWINTLMLSLYREKLIIDQNKNTEVNQFDEISQRDFLKTIKNNNNANIEPPSIHCDTHFESIMPKLSLSIYPCEDTGNEISSNSDLNKKFIKRPSSIEIGFARICIANQDTNTSSSLSNSKQEKSLQESCKKCYEASKTLCNKQNKFHKNSTSINKTELDATEVKINFLAPCFRDLLKNQNLSYLRYDLSSDGNLTKLINTTNEANNAKSGLFLRSLNKNVLSKNANKDSWAIEFESMWIDFLGNAYSKSTESCSLSQNTSFKIYLVNVWNFYKSTPSTEDSTSDFSRSNSISSMKKDSFDLALTNNQYDSLELELLVNNSNYFHQENFDRAFNRLTNVIKINKIIESDNSKNEYKNIPKKSSKRLKRSNSLSLPSSLIQNQQSAHYLCQQIYSRLNAIGYINEMNVTINHSQILFLLRLLDIVEIFTNQLKEDAENTLKYQSAVTSHKFHQNDETSKDKNNNFSSQKESNVGENSNELSVNVSIFINKLELELDINDHVKEENLQKNNNNTKISPTKASKITPERKSSSNSSKNTQKDKLDTKSLISLEKIPGLVIKDPMLHEIKIDDFDIISRQLDIDFMTGYLNFIYGLSNENPNLRHCFINVNNAFTPTEETNNSFLNEKTSSTMAVSYSNANTNSQSSISLVSSMTKSASNSSNSSAVTSGSSNPLSFFKNKKEAAQSENLDADFYDDNDSLAVMLCLDQDDTSSLASYSTELLNPASLLEKEIKLSPNKETPSNLHQQNQKQRQHSIVSISSSSSSSLANSLTINTKQLNQNSPSTLLNNNDIPENSIPIIFSSIQTQTKIPNKKVKIVLNNLNVYVQQSEKGLCVLSAFDEIEMENNKSKFKNGEEESEFVNKEEEFFERLIFFKALENRQKIKCNQAEILIKNFQFELNIPTLIGLIEIIEDEDFYEPDKLSLPVNVSLTNCKFSLNDNPGDFNKPINLSINKLLVNKLSNNEIHISEMSLSPNYQIKKFLDLKNLSNFSLKQNGRIRRKSLTKEIEYDNQFNSFKTGSILSFSYKSIHDNSNADQIASLVWLLRQQKEENRKLRLELQKERNELIDRKDPLNIKPIAQVIKKYQSPPKNHKSVNDFILTDKTEKDHGKETLLEKFALERTQFESLLKKYQEENEILKLKLEKSEKNFQQINIERDILVKKLNSKIK